jgi:transcriptional regulator with XRE-family HTH domain
MSEGGFGTLLRARRSGAGLTQEDLAERSGLSVRAIRDLERGRVARPRRETVRLLATALGLPEDESEEFLRLARQALPPSRLGRVDAEIPTAPADEMATAPKAEAADHWDGHAHGRRPVARYGILLCALLAGAALSCDRGPLATLAFHHGPRASRTASRAAYVGRMSNDDAPPGRLATVGDDLELMHAVSRGETLIVTVALTGVRSGAVTVTDTVGNIYRPAGLITSRDGNRLLLFAVVDAKPLDTLDQITVVWPRATAAHIAVDAFRGITAAGPWTGAESDTGRGTSTESVTSAGPPLCAAGDLFFTAMSAPNGPTPHIDAPWQEAPWRPPNPPPPHSPALTTAYRSITSADNHCTVHGTATPPWQTITLRASTELGAYPVWRGFVPSPWCVGCTPRQCPDLNTGGALSGTATGLDQPGPGASPTAFP